MLGGIGLNTLPVRTSGRNLCSHGLGCVGVGIDYCILFAGVGGSPCSWEAPRRVGLRYYACVCRMFIRESDGKHSVTVGAQTYIGLMVERYFPDGDVGPNEKYPAFWSYTPADETLVKAHAAAVAAKSPA